MRRILTTLGMILLFAGPLWAQHTLVTGQVKDSNGSLYSNCTGSASFVGQNNTPGAGPYLLGGSTFQTVVPFNCDSNGNIAVTVADNNQISPGPSQWNFTFTSTGGYLGGPFSFNLQLTVTGSTQNITTQLMAAAPILPVPSGGGGGGVTGTINAGLLGQFTFYPGAGTTVQGSTRLTETGGNTLNYTGSGGMSITVPGGNTALTLRAGNTTSFALNVPNGQGIIGFNTLRSSSNTPATTGSLQLGPPDPIKSHDVTNNIDVVLLKKWTVSGTPTFTASGDTRRTQLGDVYGAQSISTIEAPLFVQNGDGGYAFGEGTGVNFTPVAGSDYLYGDSTAHRILMSLNGGAFLNVGGIAAAGTPANCVQLATNGIDYADAGAPCSSVGANALVNNPATSQTAQSQSSTGVSLIGKCPAGAAATLACSQVVDNTGTQVWAAEQNGTVQIGTAGSVAGSITGTAWIGPNANPALSGLVRGSNTDTLLGWRNNLNNADITCSKNNADLITCNTAFAATSTVAGNSVNATNSLNLSTNGTAQGGSGAVTAFFSDLNTRAEVIENNVQNLFVTKVVPCGSANNVAPVTVSTSTTNDQNLMSCQFNAGLLNILGRNIEIWVAGVYSTPVGSSATINLKIKLCSVSGCGSGTVVSILSITSTANPGTVTNNGFNLTGYSTTQTAGASSVYEAHGNMRIDLGALTTSASTTFGDTNTAVSAAIDSTATIFFQVTGAFSAASASNSMTERHLLIKVLN